MTEQTTFNDKMKMNCQSHGPRLSYRFSAPSRSRSGAARLVNSSNGLSVLSKAASEIVCAACSAYCRCLLASWASSYTPAHTATARCREVRSIRAGQQRQGVIHAVSAYSSRDIPNTTPSYHRGAGENSSYPFIIQNNEPSVAYSLPKLLLYGHNH